MHNYCLVILSSRICIAIFPPVVCLPTGGFQAKITNFKLQCYTLLFQALPASIQANVHWYGCPASASRLSAAMVVRRGQGELQREGQDSGRTSGGWRGNVHGAAEDVLWASCRLACVACTAFKIFASSNHVVQPTFTMLLPGRVPKRTGTRLRVILNSAPLTLTHV